MLYGQMWEEYTGELYFGPPPDAEEHKLMEMDSEYERERDHGEKTCGN